MTTLDKLKELSEAATPGPWERLISGHLITRSSYVTHEWNHGVKSTTDIICKPSIEHNVSIDDENNYLFIAASRTAIPLLIAEIEILREALSFYEKFTVSSRVEGGVFNPKLGYTPMETISEFYDVNYAKEALAQSHERLP